MKKKWKKIMAAWCAATMLVTMPGTSALAEELADEAIITVAENPYQETNALAEREMDVEVLADDVSNEEDVVIKAESVEQENPEEIVGVKTVTVGDGVTATFDENTGDIELYSNGGTLWKDWLDKSGIEKLQIKSIRVASGTVYLPKDSSRIFSIYVGYEDTIKVVSNLSSLDMKGFNTSNVTNMSGMFYNCIILTSLDLSGFDTSNVTNMSDMFYDCKYLTELNLSSFNTSNVTDMSKMFFGCWSLTSLNLRNFNTSKVMSMYDMFEYCTALTSLDVSSFDTSNVTDMNSMFSYCSGLTNLDVSGFDTSNVTDMSYMFSNCNSLTSLDLSNFDTSNVTGIAFMFWYCTNLTSLNLSSFSTSNVTDMSYMFYNCNGLTRLDVSSFDTSNVTAMIDMFSCCTALTNLDVSSFDTSNVTDMSYMFSNCTNLKVLCTPKKHTKSGVTLPITMYDNLEKGYTELPILDKSITLIRNPGNLCIILLDLSHFIEVYYTDKMFSESSYEYNHSLARFSSAISLFSYKSKDLIKDGYKTLGFTISDDSIEKIKPEDATGDKANYAIGKKEITTDDGQYTLVALSIVGSNGREWITNFQPGTGDTHQYFLEGKKHVRSALDEYMEKNGLTDTSKVANLLAAEIDNGFYKVEPENIYTYTFATPKNTRLPDTSDSLYENIFNIVNPEDFVTWCMPEAWGFSRYGHTLTLPSKSNTNNTLYKGYLRQMQSEFSHYRDGSYDPYQDGQLPVYLVYKHVVLHAWNQKAYEQIRYPVIKYPILLGYGPSVKQRSFRDFFSGGLAPIIISDALKRADKGYEVAAAALVIADSFFTSAYGPVIQFFLLEEALGKIPGTGGWSQNQTNQSIISKLKQLPTAINENFTDAHLMETYAAYMMTLEEEVINKTKMPYVSVLNWPGNIEIFNADGELVGSVIDNVVDETIEKRVAIEVDGDFKSFMIPEGEAYTVNLSENDAGVMDYSVIQLDGEGNELERHNYLNVDVPASQEWEIEYPEDRESVDDIIVKDNTNDTVIPVTESIDEDWQGTLSVDVSVEGIGAAEGITNLTSGDCVTLTAYTDDNNYFEGWYEAGDLVSEDSEYSFIVTENRELIARFSSVIVPATGIKLQESEKQLTVDEDYLLLPELIPENATRQEILFSSSDESVATVSEYGLVIAVGTGSTVITASSNDGEYTDTCTITVNEITKKDPTLRFRDIQVTKTTLDAAFTNTLTKETDGTVMFKSSDTKVATVDSTTGLVTIKGIGTATITATASEGKNYKAGSTAYSLIVKAPPTPTPTPKPTVSGFSDVQDPNHAYYKAIYWAADAGITKGYSDGTFGINRSCTRGEMMMFLWRYAGKPAPKNVSKSPFKDVPKTHTFYKAILWGSQKGITKGYSDGTFGVNRNVSRGECMMFLWRLKGKPAPKAVAKAPFPDVPKSHVFYNAVLWGYQKKITTGFTSGKLKGKFGVNENCSRGQIVTFLYRAK